MEPVEPSGPIWPPAPIQPGQPIPPIGLLTAPAQPV